MPSREHAMREKRDCICSLAHAPQPGSIQLGSSRPPALPSGGQPVERRDPPDLRRLRARRALHAARAAPRPCCHRCSLAGRSRAAGTLLLRWTARHEHVAQPVACLSLPLAVAPLRRPPSPPPCRDGRVAVARQPHRCVDHQALGGGRVRRLHCRVIQQRHPGAQVRGPAHPPSLPPSLPSLEGRLYRCLPLPTHRLHMHMHCTLLAARCRCMPGRAPYLAISLGPTSVPCPLPPCPPCVCRSIGETVEEVSDSGFNGNVPTLQVQLLADDSMLQVGGCRGGVRT